MGKPAPMLAHLTVMLTTGALLHGCGRPEPTPDPTPAPAPTPERRPVFIDIRAPEGYDVLDDNSTVTLVGTEGGFQFTEGPVWVPGHNVWIFSDVAGDTMYKLNGSDVAVYRFPSKKANGNIWHDNRLLTCEHVGRAVVYTDIPFVNDVTSRLEVVSEFDGKPLNSPNDIVIGKGGVMYFTDPTYGENPVFGHGQPVVQRRNLFRYDPTTEELRSVWATDDGQPNGLAFNEDFTKLYLSDSNENDPKIIVFDVSADGTLSGEREFARCSNNGGFPDGMKMDAFGNLWVACPDGVEIFKPEFLPELISRRLGWIITPESATNLAFGGEGGTSLMITAVSSVWIVETKVTEMTRVQGTVAALV